MLTGEQWNQLLQGFLSEGRDLLKDAEDSLLQLETAPEDSDAVNGLFRAVHTLKGSAGIFSLTPLVNLTHHLESLLMQVRDSQRTLNEDLTSLMLRCMDELRGMLEAVDPATGEMHTDLAQQALLLDALAQARGLSDDTPVVDSVPAAPTVGANAQLWQLSIDFSEALLRNGFDPAAFLRYLSRLGEIVTLHTRTDRLPGLDSFDPEACYLGFTLTLRSAASREEIADVFDFIVDFCTLTLEPCTDPAPTLAAPAEKKSPARDRRPQDTSMVKVPAHKLDELINLVGELVISTAGAQMQAKRTGDNACIESALAVHQHVEQIRESALKLRMVEVGETFNRFHRVVRDVSKQLGKHIQLGIRGGDTELDKTVIDKIADPLTHLVRNAIDHGIESAAERLAAGKPAEGNLQLNAYHDSGMIVLEISDDGRGLNTARIREKAIGKGLIEADAVLNEAAIHRLIFEAGFSTAEQVSDLSGRGVGMDVVRSAIEQLRGSIEIESQQGLGCSFRIRLPLTLAIIDGFHVGVGQDSFVIPLDMVTECMEASAASLTSQYGYLNLRGTPLPCIALDQHFGLPASTARRRNIVVVSQGRQHAGLIVDHLLGELQTVIKPLGQMFQHLRGISGSTILGSGQVALILDVPSLFRQLQAPAALDVSLLEPLA
ncbi:chemotaxis protein CheA [Pseudomonas aylmerensis]|uniref:Chemotaxis protein CheA n=1 Tax=Pseudomonas aylmerensis TaxID=1869229 RepID=A0A2T4FM36_9PSED|nr:chemotaxis protein CheA [Pseudomonas aylmerensis]OCW25398.1 chemotaxis protein CheA [Pseudomonas aylmerensis]PTC24471.1 chemotaxis protein CheA [Pseudomonas aylmerensis]